MDCDSHSNMRELNMQAMEHFSNGKFADASAAWSAVLQNLLPYVLPSKSDLQDFDMEIESPFPVESAAFLVPTRSSTDHTDERIFSIFAQALVYTHFQLSSNLRVRTLEDYRRVAASTVYNIALSYHLQALQEGTGRYPLESALRAYKAARDLLSSIYADASASADDVKLLALAIANNEGHIRERLFEMVEVQHCLQHLHTIAEQTPWSESTTHFHETAVLFPTLGSVHLLHAPIA